VVKAQSIRHKKYCWHYRNWLLWKTQEKVKIFFIIFEIHPHVCVGYLYNFWFVRLNVEKMKIMVYLKVPKIKKFEASRL